MMLKNIIGIFSIKITLDKANLGRFCDEEIKVNS